MTDVQVVHKAEILEPAPTLEDLYSEWAMGFFEKLKGQLRQARCAAMVKRYYGQGSIAEFATHVGAAESTVYEYAAAWRRLTNAYPSEAEISNRLEDSPMTIWQIIEGVRGREAREIPAVLDEIEEKNKSVSRIQAERREEGKPKNVEMVTEFVCPACGAVSPMDQVEAREVEG